jgi:hypothetical protein
MPRRSDCREHCTLPTAALWRSGRGGLASFASWQHFRAHKATNIVTWQRFVCHNAATAFQPRMTEFELQVFIANVIVVA